MKEPSKSKEKPQKIKYFKLILEKWRSCINVQMGKGLTHKSRLIWARIAQSRRSNRFQKSSFEEFVAKTTPPNWSFKCKAFLSIWLQILIKWIEIPANKKVIIFTTTETLWEQQGSIILHTVNSRVVSVSCTQCYMLHSRESTW